MVIVLHSTMVMNTNRNSYKLESPSAKDYNNGGHYYPSPQPPASHHYHAAAMNYGGWYADTPSHQQLNATQLNLQQYEEPSATAAPTKEPVATSCRCFGLTRCDLGDASQCCGVGGAPPPVDATPGYNPGPNRSSSNVLASYGVYGGQQHHPDDDDDDDGFVPRGGGAAPAYNYHQSVVNYSGSAAVTNILRQPQGYEGDAGAAGYGPPASVGGGAVAPTGDARATGCCCLSSLCAADEENCCSLGASASETPAPAVPTTTPEPWCANWCRPTILLLLLVLMVVVFVLISSILLYFKFINFNNMSYKPRAPIIEEPCEKQYCSYGANCVTDAEGRARCQCPVDCPDVDAPVCGTDQVTYANHCLLRKKSCQDETNTRVHHSGECGYPGPSSGRRG